MSAPKRSAYALWRLNWIHPFSGGNGRTARAISYLIVCMDLGAMLPGVPSMPSIISGDRDGYLNALRACDTRWAELPNNDGSPTPYVFQPMTRFVWSAFTRQLVASAPKGGVWIALLLAALGLLDSSDRKP